MERGGRTGKGWIKRLQGAGQVIDRFAGAEASQAIPTPATQVCFVEHDVGQL
jgi:hypothetical protein